MAVQLAVLILPKIQIKKVTAGMGVVYRIYIDGGYFGAGDDPRLSAGGREANAPRLRAHQTERAQCAVTMSALGQKRTSLY
jgi:hypothetical protein